MYVQSDTLLLPDVFEYFRKKCIEIYELNPAHFLLAPGLAWQAYLKKTEVELELLIDIGVLLLIEKLEELKVEENMSSFNKNFIKNYDEDRDIGYILEVDIEYPERL